MSQSHLFWNLLLIKSPFSPKNVAILQTHVKALYTKSKFAYIECNGVSMAIELISF